MDDGENTKQSQYGAPYQSNTSRHPAPGQRMGPPSQEPYTHPISSSSLPAMATSSSARQYLPDYHYSYQPSQYQPQLQYSPSYVSDPTRSTQLQSGAVQQQYAPYSHGSMLPPAGQSSLYENIPQYQQHRQSTAIEVMTGQFGAGSMQYVQHGGTSSAVSLGQSASHFLSSQAAQPAYGSMSFARPHLQPPFAPSSSDYSMLETPIQQLSQDDASTRQATEEGRRQYELQLRVAVEAIIAGRVTEACEKLIIATEWLLGSVRALDLHHDDEENHDQRVAIWREINHAWEALGQKQKTITENAIRTRQTPPDFLSSTAIQNMINKLIQLCDQVEKYGLVDYEMGIWEEQIVDIFIQCLDLLPRDPSPVDPGSTDH